MMTDEERERKERIESVTPYKTSELAMEAVLYEVAATPKPGLVDRNNRGAHKDMDFFTFMSSAAVLHPYFEEMAWAGERAWGPSPQKMWPELRHIGRLAEDAMFEATGGVNTHKGAIFSLGLLCGCVGWEVGEGRDFRAETIMNVAAQLCQGLCEQEFSRLRTKKKKDLTKGERMYLKYGCTGIRGEAESGYATVRNVSLPVLQRLMGEGICVNDALAQTLLHLISETWDTNILSRHDKETAEYARARAREALAKGGVLSEEGRRDVEAMDQEFIERYISPGGCSDLLAVTYFLFALERFVTV